MKTYFTLFVMTIFFLVSAQGQEIHNQPLEKGGDIKRNTTYNLEEIKVRWKKAALENCPGVPCVVTPPQPSFTCGTSTVADIDGNTYNTVLIGDQCWTKENLKVTKYNDGTLIPLDISGTITGNSGQTWAPTNTGKRTVYEHNSTYLTTYGYMYNRYAATDPRKLCPIGWHVSTDAEWTTMIQTLDPSQAVNSGNVLTFQGDQSITAGGKLKKSDLWNVASPPSPGTDEKGFSAIPGGWRTDSGAFSFVGTGAFFWSTGNEATSSSAWARALGNSHSKVARFNFQRALGASIRCLKD